MQEQIINILADATGRDTADFSEFIIQSFALCCKFCK